MWNPFRKKKKSIPLDMGKPSAEQIVVNELYDRIKDLNMQLHIAKLRMEAAQSLEEDNFRMHERNKSLNTRVNELESILDIERRTNPVRKLKRKVESE